MNLAEPGLVSSCRVCLAPGRVSLRARMRRRLASCVGGAGVADQPGAERLPQRLCRSCAARLPLVHRFLTAARRTERHLLRLLRDFRLEACDAPDQLVEAAQNDNSDSNPREASSDLKKKKKKEKPIKKSLKSIRKKRKKSKRTIQCATCGSVLESLSAMNAHMRTHSHIKPYKCVSCDKSFSYRGTMIAHERRFHSGIGKTFVCDYCGKLFFRKKDVTVHIRRHTGETPYACPLCPRSFSQQATLTRHVRTHTGEKPYACKICDRRFAGQSMLKMHHLVHTDERKFTCDVCGKAVKSKDALAKHSALHDNVKSNVCDKCGMAFAAKGNLNLHIKNVHSEHSGRCAVCNRDFSNLENHMRKHTGETPFGCDVCGRSFSQRSSLSIHMSKHGREGKFSCAVDRCRETFPMKSMMEFHVLKYHTNVTPYSCAECDRGFYRNSDLSRHKKYHQNEKMTITT